MDHQGDHPVGGTVLTRVVIVDDDLFVRSTLADLLSAAPGIEVVATYDSGIEASARAAGDRAHVTLVDISMPALGGPEATARLRAACPSTKVLALTSLTDPSAAAARPTGFTGGSPRGSGTSSTNTWYRRSTM